MKLQKGQVVMEEGGAPQVVICEVTNPEKPEVVLALFGSWNNKFVADHIMKCLALGEEKLD